MLCGRIGSAGDWGENVQRLRHPAAALYRQLLATAQPNDQALLLHRLARSNRKAGLTEAALELFQKLDGSPSRIGELPAELLAKYEICLIRAEQHKLALTRAVAQVLEAPRRAVSTEAGWHLAFWRSSPFTALVLSEDFLKANFWPRVFAAASAENLEITLVAPPRSPAAGSSPSARPFVAAVRNLGELDLPWLLEARPRHPELLYADLARRQNLYLIMLLLVMALLGFGGYLTVRTVRKEMEIARLKSEFVSTVSHEFRSPVTGIRQLAEILMRGQPSEERRRQYYEMIAHESDRLARLVENVLDFARMEEDRKEYRFEPLETEAWLRTLVEEYQAESAQQGVSLAATIPEHMPVVLADREALICAVHNLLDNAVKYSSECRTVWLDAEAEAGGLIIRVRDRGVGIAEEDQDHIFEKFYRGSGEAARHVKGAGLGLSLVKHIVTAHGGSVECQSRPGEGSTFSIHLPVLASTSKENRA